MKEKKSCNFRFNWLIRNPDSQDEDPHHKFIVDPVNFECTALSRLGLSEDCVFPELKEAECPVAEFYKSRRELHKVWELQEALKGKGIKKKKFHELYIWLNNREFRDSFRE